jgi:hypothetical protein
VAPQGAIRVHLPGARLVDLPEQAAAQDLDGFVVLSWVQEGGLAGRDALGLGHLVGNELILVGIGIDAFAVLADGKRVNEGGAR